MKVLLVGSGGREHALAWKIAQSPRLDRLFIAPGNPGTRLVGENVAISQDDIGGLGSFCTEQAIDLVMIGPEAPLAAGLSDALRSLGLAVFGPSLGAAQIEASKVFAKNFMRRHHIPSAGFEVFDDYDSAARYVTRVDFPVVIKASGLAAGKGVFLPATTEESLRCLRTILVNREFGESGRQVVIEERLEGPEVSLLAFVDGKTVRPMLPAQDHKRLLAGDLGPNTGGMGAYAPAPVCPPEMVAEIVRRVLQPAVDGLRQEGLPYVGVLYAGLMLTREGLQVLEFNCRFGDPETQVLLPLLKSDLLDIAQACVEGRLDQVEVDWHQGSAACVVLASRGYPGKPETGKPILGLDKKVENTEIFHAGTKLEGEQIVSSGGRVLGVTGWGEDLGSALGRAYNAVERIQFDGMQYRDDIAYQARSSRSAYAQAGVNIDAGNRAVELMGADVKSTYTGNVLAGIGAFGGLFDVQFLKRYRNPVLAASTDGVGTKVALAAKAGRFHGIGQDIVNHCVNDILVQGAVPLFFLDYFATARLKPEVTAEIVSGVASACREAGCVLLGGETAEMPGVYTEEAFDVAGTIVGVVEREEILPRKDVIAGDVLVGLRSSGPHTNGYSLIRRIFRDVALDTVYPEVGEPLADALLAPHRSYLKMLTPLLSQPAGLIKAMAHLTGGGFLENIPRVLPEGVGAVLRRGSWPVAGIFQVIQRLGDIAEMEMLRTFNLGIGMVVVTGRQHVSQLQQMLPEESWVIGEVVQGPHRVVLQ